MFGLGQHIRICDSEAGLTVLLTAKSSAAGLLVER
jgi:hypothetical protein